MLECQSLLIRFRSSPGKVTASIYHRKPDLEATAATMSGALRALEKKLRKKCEEDSPGGIVIIAYNSFGTPSLLFLSKEVLAEALEQSASRT